MTNPAAWKKPDYGVDAPKVLRNLFFVGAIFLIAGALSPASLHFGNVELQRGSFFWLSFWFFFYTLLFLLYVKVGKFLHRDFMLSLHTWSGDEQVLDVGCGRGLLLAGAAKHLTTGHANGIDIWSNEDMGGNSEAATLRNLELEGVTERCTLISEPAQTMQFADASFDVIVSNLCLHNIYDLPTRRQALHQIARVLKPGGIALISDFKHTGQYASEFADCGLVVERRWGRLKNVLTTFPPLRTVIARKPL